MATLVGNEGTVKIGANSVGEIRDWKAKFENEIADVSTLGTGYKKTRGTLKSASGSVDCFCDPDNALQNQLAVPGAQVTLVLVMATGKQFTVPVTIESCEVNQGGTSGMVERNFAWQSNGAWT